MSRSALLTRSAGAAALAISIGALSPAAAGADEITVFAAASLANAMEEIEERFEAISDHTVTVSLAGSSALARQIIQGAPADVFLSANSDWMDRVEEAGLVKDGSRVDLLRNSIVLVAHDGAAQDVQIDPDMDLTGLLGDGRLAMALVDAVPAGIYGKAALESLDLWDDVEDQIAQSDNVRTALRLVATGEAPYGIVYATDAAAEKNATVVGAFPAETHPPIIYPAATLTTPDNPAATEFLDYLLGPGAREAFERQGFLVEHP